MLWPLEPFLVTEQGLALVQDQFLMKACRLDLTP